MAIRASKPGDLPAVIALWGEAFGDGPEAVSFFFESFPACLSYVAEEQGEVVAMVHALPQILSPDMPAAYLYAVATAKAWQGKGICRRLMAFVETDLKKRGFACCVLTPGEASLFRFYEKQGYQTAFTRNRNPFPGGEPISTADYARLREQILTAPHMIYDCGMLEYAARVYGLTWYKTPTGIAAAGVHGTAEALPEDLGGRPFAMIKWLEEGKLLQDAYLGFALE